MLKKGEIKLNTKFLFEQNPLLKLKKEPTDICKKYEEDVLVGKIMGGSITFIILVVNTLLREIIIRMIIWVGEKSNS